MATDRAQFKARYCHTHWWEGNALTCWRAEAVMVNNCAAFGCRNYVGKKKGLSFFRFPLKDKGRCEKWTAAVRRANWKPTKCSRLCNEHFVTGKPHHHPLHIDFAPTMFGEQLEKAVGGLDKQGTPGWIQGVKQSISKRKDRTESQRELEAAVTLLELSQQHQTPSVHSTLQQNDSKLAPKLSPPQQQPPQLSAGEQPPKLSATQQSPKRSAAEQLPKLSEEQQLAFPNGFQVQLVIPVGNDSSSQQIKIQLVPC